MSERTGTVVSGSTDGGGSVDYENVEITSEAPTEYHYTERRAELLQIVRSRGHPRAVSQSQIADRYGVSQQQISKDLDRLADYIEETLGSRRLLETHAVLARAVSDLLEEDDWRATRAASYNCNTTSGSGRRRTSRNSTSGSRNLKVREKYE